MVAKTFHVKRAERSAGRCRRYAAIRSTRSFFRGLAPTAKCFRRCAAGLMVRHLESVGLRPRLNAFAAARLRSISLLLCLCSCLWLAGCGSSEQAASSGKDATARADQPEVMLLIAASTAEPVEEIAELFRQARQVRVKISAGSSSGLAQQIIAGAPADIFLSANETWASAIRETIQEQGMAVESGVLLANRLVLIVPRGNPADVSSPEDLNSKRVERIALAGENVPAGIYADQALRALGLRDALVGSGKIVRGHNVRIALGYVAQEEADAGIGYATDARLSDRVEVVFTFPVATHDPIRYPALLLKRERANPVAAEFFEFLFTEQAGDVFRKYGFARTGAAPTPNTRSR